MKTYYKVLVGESPEELSNVVNEHVNGGWWLQGGIALTVSDGVGLVYAQAVTKTEGNLPAEMIGVKAEVEA